jgi:hypothetical protein
MPLNTTVSWNLNGSPCTNGHHGSLGTVDSGRNPVNESVLQVGTNPQLGVAINDVRCRLPQRGSADVFVVCAYSTSLHLQESCTDE